MEQLLSPSTWSTECAVADPGAENMGVGYGRLSPFPPRIFLKFLLVLKCIFSVHSLAVLSVCFCSVIRPGIGADYCIWGDVGKGRREGSDQKGTGNLAPSSFLQIGPYASRTRLV